MLPIRSIRTKAKAEALLREMYPHGMMGGISDAWRVAGIDTEYDTTKDHKPLKDRLAYMQLCNGKQIFIVSGPLADEARGKKPKYLTSLFRPYLEDCKAKKYLSTQRAESTIFRDTLAKCDLRGVMHDTEIASWLLDENQRSHGLKENARQHIGFHMEDYAKLFRYFPFNKARTKRLTKAKVASFREVLLGQAANPDVPWKARSKSWRKTVKTYIAKDPYASLKLGHWQRKRLKRLKLLEWFDDVEMPFSRTLLRTERRGIGLDVETVANIYDEVTLKVMRIDEIARQVTGKPDFNMNSPQQLSAYVFGELKWPVLARNDLTEAQEEDGEEEGNASLNKAVLKKYAAPPYKYSFANLILERRLYGTMRSNFLAGALNKRDRATNKLHTVFKQARTVTGRLSSGDKREGLMNLQNIPVDKDKDPYVLRRFFLPPDPLCELVVGDYSQVELFILAILSGDKRMLEAFRRGEDIHMITAAAIFKLPLPKEPSSWDKSSGSYQRWHKECEAWKEKYKLPRKRAKAVVYGLNYGLTKYKLAADHEMEVDEAQEWIDGYFDLYPGVLKYNTKVIKFLHANGYIVYPSGRRRRLPDALSGEQWQVSRAERQATNAGMQGMAADIIKVAMNAIEIGPSYKVSSKLYDMKRAGPSLTWLHKHKHELLIQVHDELLGQIKKKWAPEAVPHFKTAMESSFPKFFNDGGLALQADVGHGPNWATAKH